MKADAHPEALVLRAAIGFAEAKRLMAKMMGPLCTIAEEDSVLFISMGLEHPRFNPVVVVLPPRNPARVIERARDFYGRLKKPWELEVLGTWAPEVIAEARRAGLELVSENPGLVLSPLGALGHGPPELDVREVRDADTLREFNDVIASGFGIDRSKTSAFDDVESLRALGIERYLGYVGNTAVVTGMRVSAMRMAAVFNVVTLPEYRRRGYGDWLTRLSALEGAEEGCVASCLESTVAGYSMYLKLGYEHVFNFYSFREPES